MRRANPSGASGANGASGACQTRSMAILCLVILSGGAGRAGVSHVRRDCLVTNVGTPAGPLTGGMGQFMQHTLLPRPALPAMCSCELPTGELGASNTLGKVGEKSGRRRSGTS